MNRVGSMGFYIFELSRILLSENNFDVVGEFILKVCIKFNVEFFMDYWWKVDKFMYKVENFGRRMGRDFFYWCIYCYLLLYFVIRFLDFDKVLVLMFLFYGIKCFFFVVCEFVKRCERWYLVLISVKIVGSFVVRID